MRGEVPIKYVLKGDREAGKRFMRRGAVLMGMLEHSMTYQGLKQSVMRRWITPDVLIECDCRFGLRTVTITVAPVAVETGAKPEKPVFGWALVVVSDVAGIALYSAPGWREDFVAGRSLHGRYERMEDGYQFASSYTQSFPLNYMYRIGYVSANSTTEETRRTDGGYRFHSTLYELVAQGERGFVWDAPALMPCPTDGEIALSFLTIYEADLPQVVAPIDYLRLSEISVMRHDQDGRQERRTKFVDIERGWDTQEIAPQPERNGVQRFVTLPFGETVRRQGVSMFNHVSLRPGHDMRCFPVEDDMLAGPSGPYPESLLPWLSVADDAGGGYAFTGDDGAVHAIHALMQNPDYDVFGDTGESRRWEFSLCFIRFPVLSVGMTPEEERAALRENTSVTVLTGERILPALDALSQTEGDVLQRNAGWGLRRVLGKRNYDPAYSTGWGGVCYEWDGETRNPDRPPFDIDDPDLEVNWERAWRMFTVLFDPLPADNAVWHSGDGLLFCWSRVWGCIAMTQDGLFRRHPVLPPETETPGVRPGITYAGNGLYCCVCEDTRTWTVTAAYLGAPFDAPGRDAGWTAIPLTTEEWTEAGNRIMHIRPALVTAARVVLLAIVREVDPETGAARYRTAVCDGSPGAGTTLLKFLGVIPMPDTDGAFFGYEGLPPEDTYNYAAVKRLRERPTRMSFDLCLSGDDGEYAAMLRRYPTPPRARRGFLYSRDYLYQNRDQNV